MFVKPSTGWKDATENQELTSADGEAGDYFGYTAAAIENGTLVVGAGYHKVGTHVNQGEAYVFTAPPPSISISTPANGAVFTQHQAVNAAYACTAPSATTITSCAGTTAVGAPIDTSTLGAHSFTVNTEDSDGVTATQTVTYSVVAPMPPILKLSIGAVGQSASVWREGNGLAQISSKKKPPLGTTFSFTLNEAGAVTFTFSHQVGGRRAHGKCVAPSSRNKHKAKCKRTVTTRGR